MLLVAFGCVDCRNNVACNRQPGSWCSQCQKFGKSHPSKKKSHPSKKNLTPQPDWWPFHRAQTSWQIALASVVSSSPARCLLCQYLLQRRSPAAWPRLTFLLSRELLRWSAGLRSRIFNQLPSLCLAFVVIQCSYLQAKHTPILLEQYEVCMSPKRFWQIVGGGHNWAQIIWKWRISSLFSKLLAQKSSTISPQTSN